YFLHTCLERASVVRGHACRSGLPRHAVCLRKLPHEFTVIPEVQNSCAECLRRVGCYASSIGNSVLQTVPKQLFARLQRRMMVVNQLIGHLVETCYQSLYGCVAI